MKLVLFFTFLTVFSNSYASSSVSELVSVFMKPDTSVLMIGETHTDLISRQHYPSIIQSVFENVKDGCLFLEVDQPLQSQLDLISEKSDIAESQKMFYEAVSQYEYPNIKTIPITEKKLQVYGPWIAAVIEAKKLNVKVFAMDDGLAYLQSNESFPQSEFIRRNQVMSDEIEKHFQNKDCKKAISLNGMAHLFMESKEILSIPTLLKAKGIKTQLLYLFSDSDFFAARVGVREEFPLGANLIRTGARFQDTSLFWPAMLRYVNDPNYWTPYHGTDNDGFLLNF